jgi:cholera toxin transcriptional activator
MEEGARQRPAKRYRFGVFEADAATGELHRQGMRVKLNAQPFQVLLMFLERPGELLSREEISRRLWPDGTFVDFDHGVNSAVNRLREALGDTVGSPIFIETVARHGYRFLAPVEQIVPASHPLPVPPHAPVQPPGMPAVPIAHAGPAAPAEPEPKVGARILATPQELPKVPHLVVQTLFILFQLMYLGFYIGALANLAEIDDLVSPLPKSAWVFSAIIVTAATLIPVRAFLLSAVIFHAPRIRLKFLKLWPFLVVLDVLWSLSPFLLLHHINFGLALACTTLLVYSPFAQRSLILMGAGAKLAPPTS